MRKECGMMAELEKRNDKKMGERIRRYRKEKCLSQEQLAEKAQVGATHISHIENDKAKMSLDVFISIANTLDVSADQLLCDYLLNTKYVYEGEIMEELKDMNDEEIRITKEVIRTLKSAMRNHPIKRRT